MQNETTTAGKTALPYSRFEEEIIRLNRERDEKLTAICVREDALTAERLTLRQQKRLHVEAIEAANRRIEELKEAIHHCETEKQELRADTNSRKQRVMEEADAWFNEHPTENWLWKKVYRFFKKHPDLCVQIMKEEGGEQ